MNNVTVILRECGERTSEQVHRLLCTTFSPSQVFRVSEVPFSQSLRASLLLGIEQDREFVLCVDADVLPFSGAFKELILEFKSLPSHVSEIQGMVFDNLLQIWRPAGNHLYRTTLLPKAVQLIPEEGASLRPESDMLSALVRRGNPWVQSKCKIGIHDFEQKYEDIYRKAFLGAIKHDEFRPYLALLWLNLSRSNDEFKVALEALSRAVSFEDNVSVDKKFMADEIQHVLAKLDLDEQANLSGAYKCPPIESLAYVLPEDIEQLRQQCQATIHYNLFTKLQSRLRILMSLKLFERVLS